MLFIGDKHLTLAAWARIQSTLPDNVYVKRLPKGWNNAQEHCVIIRLLGMILAPVLDRYQPVLMFDAVGLHLAAEVMEELTLARLWYVVIPARLTFLLQPLDTHGFAKYKRHLKKRFQDRIAGPEDSNVTEHMVGLSSRPFALSPRGNVGLRRSPATASTGTNRAFPRTSKTTWSSRCCRRTCRRVRRLPISACVGRAIACPTPPWCTNRCLQQNPTWTCSPCQECHPQFSLQSPTRRTSLLLSPSPQLFLQKARVGARAVSLQALAATWRASTPSRR